MLVLHRHLGNGKNLGVQRLEFLPNSGHIFGGRLGLSAGPQRVFQSFEVQAVQLGSGGLDCVLDKASAGLTKLADAGLLLGVLGVELPA